MNQSDQVLPKLTQAWSDLAHAKDALRDAEKRVRELVHEAVDRICPEIVRSNSFIPLTPTTGLVVHRLEMAPPLVAGASPHWVARGHKIRFRVGNEESVGPFFIEQPAYEALPEEVRTLDRKEMLNASREQKLTGMDAPLKLTDRQRQMFSLLANNNEKLRFLPTIIDGGQRLPSAIWDSSSSTQAIWTAMIKRGVLEIVQGNLSDPFSRWRVNPGPRFPDAVALVAKHFQQENPGSIAAERFFQAFGVSRPKPAQPR